MGDLPPFSGVSGGVAVTFGPSNGWTRDAGPPATARLTIATDQVAIGTALPVAGRKVTIVTTGADQGIRVSLTALGDNVLDALLNAEAFPRIQITASGLALGPGVGAFDWSLLRTGVAEAAITGSLVSQGRTVATSFNVAGGGAYTVLATDEFVGMDTTGAPQAVLLPAAVSGRRIVVQNTALVAVVNACSVTPNGLETINGVGAAVLLTGAQRVTLYGRTGVGWFA